MAGPQRVSTRDKDEAKERYGVLPTHEKTHQILESPEGNLTKYQDKICLPVTSNPPQSWSHSLWLQEPHNWRKCPLSCSW